jgi:hypothetical protein
MAAPEAIGDGGEPGSQQGGTPPSLPEILGLHQQQKFKLQLHNDII